VQVGARNPNDQDRNDADGYSFQQSGAGLAVQGLMDVQGFRLSILLSKHSEARLSNIAHFHPYLLQISARKRGRGRWKGQSGNAGGNDRRDASAREFFHGQILQFGMESV
jgi:hypothetical protein